MSHSVTVDLQCPLCDGTLTATCSPESIDDLTDAGCGHADILLTREGRSVWDKTAKATWEAVASKEYDAYLDAQDSRFSAWRDR